MTLLDVARDLRIAAEEATADCPAKALHFAEKAVRELRERLRGQARPGLRVVQGPEHISAVLGRALEQVKLKAGSRR